MFLRNFFDPISFLIVLGILVALFLIFRELVAWYWKINKIVDILERIEKNTGLKKEGERVTVHGNTEQAAGHGD